MVAWFYILRLRSGAYYCGATENLELRIFDHKNGRGCKTTKLDPPIDLAYSEEFLDFAAARGRETQVKKWSRAKKEALIAGNTTQLKSLAKSRETK